MRLSAVHSTRVAPWIVPSILVILAFFPTEALEVYLGVPLRIASGELAAAILRVTHPDADFQDFVLRCAGLTPLLVVPECAGLGKFLLLIALAIVLAHRSALPTRPRFLTLGFAAALAIAANALRLIAISILVPTVADRVGRGGVLHECCALIPFVLAAAVLIFALRDRLGRPLAPAPSRDRAFLAGSASLLLAFAPVPALEGERLVPTRTDLERAGYTTRVVDSWIDGRGRPLVGIEGAAFGRSLVRYECFETIDGSRAWPDLYAVRFARLAGIGTGPIRHLVIDPSIPASGL